MMVDMVRVMGTVEGYRRPYYNRNNNGRGFYMAGRGQNKFVRKNDIVGERPEECYVYWGAWVDTTSCGAIGGSDATSDQAGSQGTSATNQ
jgi:hypothetical protein